MELRGVLIKIRSAAFIEIPAKVFFTSILKTLALAFLFISVFVFSIWIGTAFSFFIQAVDF